MATFADSLKRMRRFLRDPEGNIWEDEDIRIAFNDAQLEIASKINYIERVHAYRYPPLYTWAYFWDWEVQHIDGDLYQAMHNWPANNMVICYPWEPGYYLEDVTAVAAEEAVEYTYFITEDGSYLIAEDGSLIIIE